MSTARGEFASKFGFIMAAAGSAVGLGNISNALRASARTAKLICYRDKTILHFSLLLCFPSFFVVALKSSMLIRSGNVQFIRVRIRLKRE